MSAEEITNDPKATVEEVVEDGKTKVVITTSADPVKEVSEAELRAKYEEKMKSS